MRHSTILYIVLGVLAVAGLLVGVFFASVDQKQVSTSESTPSATLNISKPEDENEPTLTVPAVTETEDPTTVTPDDPFDPNDPYGNGDIADDELPDDPGVVVVNVEIEDVKPVDPTDPTADPEPVIDPRPTPETFPDPPEDKTVQEIKAPDVEPDPEVKPDIINDEITEKKEEAEEEKKKDEDEKPVTVVEETKTTVREEDKEVKANDETDDTKPEENNGSGPVFVNPAKGGTNPFEDPGDTEIDEHDSDEYVDDDGDKPGEGIHF